MRREPYLSMYLLCVCVLCLLFLRMYFLFLCMYLLYLSSSADAEAQTMRYRPSAPRRHLPQHHDLRPSFCWPMPYALYMP